MELREFAEHVLYGTSFEEKLILPIHLTDTQPGSSAQPPPQPVRPEGFGFNTGDRDKTFPSPADLGEGANRAIALIHFANHEMLAAELMALMILKFPEADRQFRMGLAATLKEEIIHTRLYLNRLEALGWGRETKGVSDYFWRAVSGVESPIDYITRLSLTFEQANLDFTRYYETRFREVGDPITARILQKIGRDEINHVAFGLKWFRKWKPEDTDDWQYFQSRLVFPLSPARAKGLDFNAEARVEAGLNEVFIENLRLFSQSKGRCPNVYWFNPGGELKPGQKKDAIQWTRLQENLSILSVCLAGRDDLVILSKPISTRHQHYLQECGMELPAQVVWDHGKLGSNQPLLEHKLERFIPWSSGDDSLIVYEQLKSRCQGRIQPLKPLPLRLFKKSEYLNSVIDYIRAFEDLPWLATPADFGSIETTLPGVIKSVKSLREAGYERILFKAPFGASGRGQLRLFEDRMNRGQETWIRRILEEQSELIVQPWLERVMDFSLQIKFKPGQVTCQGYTHLINHAGGQFRAVECYPDFRHRLPPALRRLLVGTSIHPHEIAAWYGDFIQALSTPLKGHGYEGPAGIDGFLFRTAQGQLKLFPCSEINPRHTFGTLMVALMNKIKPGLIGKIELHVMAEKPESNREAIQQLVELSLLNKPKIHRTPARQVIGPGFITLNEMEPDTRFVASLEIRDSK